MAKETHPLLEAARWGKTSVVKKLLKQGANAKMTDSWKQTGLHVASIDGHVDIAREFLARGVDPNARHKSGGTALQTAAGMFAGPEFFRLLLDHGADVAVKDEDGRTPIDQIFSRVDGQGQPLNRKRVSVCKLLIAHGAAATPEQIRRVGGVEARALKAKIATFDWAALEADLLASSTRAISAFAKRHAHELFYGFCFDCNASAHGDVSCCLNTVDALKRFEEAGGRPRRDSKWNPGNWVYQEFANLGSDRRWRARVAPLGDEDGLEKEAANRLLESIARVALRLVATRAFSALRRTDDFNVFVIDHDETYKSASARMKRARAAAGRKGK